MKKKKPKQKQVTRRSRKPSAESLLNQAEALYAKLGGLHRVATSQAQTIRRAAMHHHDQTNAQLAELGKQLEAQYPAVDPARAQQYGRLLKQRGQLQGAIHKQHRAAWDQDNEGV